jgi:hypothetical protein
MGADRVPGRAAAAADLRQRNWHRAANSYAACVLATKILQVKPYDRESKGVLEQANQFLETSFLPGRAFLSP